MDFLRHIFILFVVAISIVGDADVLRWMVDEHTTVDGASIQQFLVPYPSTDDTWPAARVKLVSSDRSSSTILKIWGANEDGVEGWLDGEWGAEVADWGDSWGTGVPTGNQSETGYNTIHRVQDQLAPSYPPEVMDAMFVMELGYNSWNEDAGDYVWETIAQSNPELYRDLVDKYMYATGDIAPPNLAVWSPDFYTSPEPNSAVLFLLGSAFLMLRRKHNAH